MIKKLTIAAVLSLVVLLWGTHEAYAFTVQWPRIPYTFGNSSSNFYSWSSSGGGLMDIETDTYGYLYWEFNGSGGTDALILATTTASASDYSLTLNDGANGYRTWIFYERSGGLSDLTWAGLSGSGGPGTEISTFTVDGVTISAYRTNGINGTSTQNALYPGFGAGIRIATARATGRIYLITYTDEDLSYINTQAELYAYIDAIGTGGGAPGASNTRIIEQQLPTNGSLASDEFVNFQFTYYMNDVATPNITTAGVEIRDMTANLEYLPLTDEINASGQSTFLEGRLLEPGHAHMWRAFLTSDDGTERYYGTWYSLEVVSYSAPGDYIDPETGEPINATSSSFWDFLNVPNLLKTKAPTGYVYQIGTLILSVEDISATTTPSFVLPAAFASTTLPALAGTELFSANTVTQLIPPTLISILRGIMVAVLYIGLAFGLLHKSEHLV